MLAFKLAILLVVSLLLTILIYPSNGYLLPFLGYYDMYPDPYNTFPLNETQASVASAAMFVILALGSFGFLPLNLADVAKRIDQTRIPALFSAQSRSSEFDRRSSRRVPRPNVKSRNRYRYRPTNRRYRRNAEKETHQLEVAGFDECFSQIMCQIISESFNEFDSFKTNTNYSEPNLPEPNDVYFEKSPNIIIPSLPAGQNEDTITLSSRRNQICTQIEPRCLPSLSKTVAYGRLINGVVNLFQSA